MDKEVVKAIITSSVAILTALLPLIINYFSKKNKDSEFKNLLDQSQNKINFINSYYDSLHRFLPDAEINILKSNLAAELYELKNKINESNETHATRSKAHFTFQKIFLTFKPVSFMGWVWAVLFYINLIIFFFMLLGTAIDDKTSEFSLHAFRDNLFKKNDGSFGAIILMIGLLLLFRWLAVRNYKHNQKISVNTS
ncbi:MAG: hypothetical protein JO072_07330 [Parafilimonas sp.]|nr:hypothetical protein [Parafilimonas sp.]